MQPSSLIFVVVVAVWALYLVQHWVRRREYLATARSVDRFSEAIRLLNVPAVRHDVIDVTLDETSVSVGGPSPASVSSRSMTGGSPLVARVSTRPVVRPAPAAADEPDGAYADRDWSRVLHRVLGLAFVIALPAPVVTAVLASMGRLPWAVVGVTAAALGAVVLGLGRLAASRRSRQLQRRRAAHEASRPGRAAVVAESRPDSDPAVVPTRGAQPAPGSWTPVPVPRPTYTMKAKAERPAPAPVESAPPAPAASAETRAEPAAASYRQSSVG